MKSLWQDNYSGKNQSEYCTKVSLSFPLRLSWQNCNAPPPEVFRYWQNTKYSRDWEDMLGTSYYHKFGRSVNRNFSRTRRYAAIIPDCLRQVNRIRRLKTSAEICSTQICTLSTAFSDRGSSSPWDSPNRITAMSSCQSLSFRKERSELDLEICSLGCVDPKTDTNYHELSHNALRMRSMKVRLSWNREAKFSPSCLIDQIKICFCIVRGKNWYKTLGFLVG